VSRCESGGKEKESGEHGQKFFVREWMKEQKDSEGVGIETSTLATNEGAYKFN